jgi:hypothetical protein
MPLAFNGSGPVDLGDVDDGQFIKRVGNVLVGADAVTPDDSRLSDARTPTSHASSHQNGNGDEISVAGLSGLLADAQTPLAHTHPLAEITNEGALAGKNTVATADIDNDAVTYAKIQNVTDARLLGRSAGSDGDVQEITVGSGLSLSAGALTATGGGGGVSQMIVPLVSDGAGITWTNMPSAVTFFGGSHRFATKINLTDYTQVRLIVNKQGTAGAAASIVRLRYRTAFDATVSNWLQIGESASVQVAVNVTNTVLDSGWINLATGAKADVFVVLDGSGGDGVLDPVFGSLVAQFR